MKQLLLKTSLTLCIIYGIYICMQLVQVVHIQQMKAISAGFDSGFLHGYQSWSDFSITFFALIGLILVRKTITPVFMRIGDILLHKDKWSISERKERVQRFGVVCFKLTFFVCISIAGFVLLRDQIWWPSILGGSGDTSACFSQEWPLQVVNRSVKIYYLLQMAYHLHSLVYQFILRKRNDFYEMVFHHIVTVLLILCSYMMNYIRIGTLVLFVHDIADVAGYAIKTSVDTKYKSVTLSLYVLLLVVWGFSRLYVFPLYIVYSAIYEVPHEILGQEFMVCLLCALLCLHIYWYSLFIRMGMQASKSKGDDLEDIQNKITDKEAHSVVDLTLNKIKKKSAEATTYRRNKEGNAALKRTRSRNDM